MALICLVNSVKCLRKHRHVEASRKNSQEYQLSSLILQRRCTYKWWLIAS